MNFPASPGTSTGPPQSLVAPAATASSISSTTVSYWSVGGHRADLGLPVERVADPQPLRLARDAGDEAVGDLAHPRRPARSPSRSGRRWRSRPRSRPLTALPRSASAQTIIGSLPPSSSTLPFSSSAQTRRRGGRPRPSR